MRTRLATMALMTLMGGAGSVRATDQYWSGAGATSDNLDQPDNWFTTNPASGDNLYFNNTTGIRHWPFSNYGAGSFFGYFITYSGAGGIKLRGDKTYLLKFENSSDTNLLEAEADLSNRTGPDNDLEINPVGSGGVTVSNVDLQNGMQLKVYGANTLNVVGNITQSGSGSASVAVMAGARVVLRGANNFGGGALVSQGALVLNNVAAGGTNVVTLGDGGTGTNSVELDLGANLSFANPIAVAASGTGPVLIKDLATALPHVGHSGGLSAQRAVTLKTSGTGDHVMGFNGAITGGGTITVDGVAGSLGAGGNRVAINASQNSFTGNVVVLPGGILQNNANNIFGAQTACVTRLQLDGYFRGGQGLTLNIAALTGAGELNGYYAGGNTVVVGCNNDGGTFSGRLTAGASGGNLIKVGSGTEVLTGANTIGQGGGSVTISGGVLQYGDGGTTGNAGTTPITVNGAMVINRSNTSTWSQIISGTGSVTVAGGGAATFSGANSYSGPTTISGSTLLIGGSGVLGGGTYAGAITNDGGFVYSSTAAQTLSGVISGSGWLTQQAGGVLTLSNSNIFRGGVTVSRGTLQLNHTRAAGTNVVSLGDAGTGTNNVQLTLGAANISNELVVTTNGSGTATLFGNAQFQGNLGAITLNRPTTFQIFNSGGGDWWYSFNNIGGGVGTLTLRAGTVPGANRITLSSANTFTGEVVAAQGRLQLNAGGALGSTNNDLTISSGADIRLIFANQTVNRFSGAGGLFCDIGSQTLSVGAADGGGVFSGAMTLTIGLTKLGLGTQTLAGTGIAYSGATLVRGGTLVLSNTPAFASAVALTNGATLQLDGVSNYSFGRVVSGTGVLVKAGAGQITLTAASTFSGSTFVQGGTLAIGGTNRLPVATALSVGGGAALDIGVNPQTVGTIQLGLHGADSATLRIAGNGISLPGGLTVSEAGGLVITGAVTLQVYGTMPPVGTTNTIITYAGAASGVENLVLALPPRVLAYLTNDVAAGRVSLVVSGVDSLRWVGHPTNAWDVAVATNWALFLGGQATVFSNGDTVVFDDTASNFVVSASGVVSPNSLTVNTTNTYLFQGGPVLAALDLRAIGSGTTLVQNIQSCANAFITNGTVVVGDGTTNGLVALTGSLVNDGWLVLNRSDNFAVSNAISGAGALIQRGSGAVTLGGASSFSGGTTISRGQLTLAHAAAAGSGPVVLGDDGTGTNAATLSAAAGSGTFSNAVVVSADGSGPAVIRGDQNYLVFSGPFTLNRATTLDGAAGDRYGYSGKISGPVGTLTINAPRITMDQPSGTSNDFTGVLVINPGRTLQLSGGGGNPIPDEMKVTVNGLLRVIKSAGGTELIGALNGLGAVNGDTGGANFTKTLAVGGENGSGSFDGTLSNGSGSDLLALSKIGTGTQALNGASSYSGGTFVNDGVLAVGHNAALGSGTLTMSGGTLMAAGGSRTIGNAVSATAPSFIDTSTGDLTMGGTMSGSSTLTKRGNGTLTLVGTNTQNASLIVNVGTLLVNGTGQTGPVTVDAGATLGGTGVVRGLVSQNGILSPGAGIGILTISNQVSCGGASVTRFELGGTNSYDQLVVSDLHILNGTLEVVTTNGYVPVSGDRFNLITNTALGGLLFGPFPSTSLPALPSGMGWEVQYSASDAVNLVVTGSVVTLTAYEQWAAQIPNPSDRSDQMDPDNDGYANLLEYSQGSDPTNNANNAKLNLVRTNGMEVIVFNRVNTATDIVYEVQASYAPTNNAEWQGLATNSVGSWGSSTNVNDDNTATIHRVWVSDLILGTNRSLRLKVTRP